MALAAKVDLRTRDVQRAIDQTCAVSAGGMALSAVRMRHATVDAIAGAVASKAQRCRSA